MFRIPTLQEAGGIAWYWYVILVLVVLGLIVWWLFRRVKKMEMDALAEPPTSPVREKREDDLTKIEGIGPKVEKVLKEAGITSFESLSQVSPAEVKSTLDAAGLQMMNPEGWIEQAHLAARGDWQGLQKLQDELKGGRRK